MSVVFDFNATLNDVAPLSPTFMPVDFYENEKEWIVDECHLYVVYWSSQLRLSSVSVVFDFRASLKDVAPVSPM